MNDLFYPHSPGHRGVDSSIEGAKVVKPSVASMHDRILRFLKERGGLTCEQLCEIMEVSKPGTMSARLRELELLKYIRKTDRRRKSRSGVNVIVWELV